jgi:ubiquinone/menaquinone biosynthesis C-methylase UbiE
MTGAKAASASSWDELPLWSAPFGLALLEAVELKSGLAVLDVGFGTGFPVLELCERLGGGARVYGADPGELAPQRALAKARDYGLGNLVLLRAVAERLPLRTGAIDLVVSNNGYNNVRDLEAALRETRRVCRPGAQLVLTFNLPETMLLFYEEFAALLAESGLEALQPALLAHIDAKRPSPASMKARLAEAGFAVRRETEGAFALRFLDGRALFRHHLIRTGFLEPWKAVLPAERADAFFARLERRLDGTAAARGELRLDVPFLCLDCRAT